MPGFPAGYAILPAFDSGSVNQIIEVEFTSLEAGWRIKVTRLEGSEAWTNPFQDGDRKQGSICIHSNSFLCPLSTRKIRHLLKQLTHKMLLSNELKSPRNDAVQLPPRRSNAGPRSVPPTTRQSLQKLKGRKHSSSDLILLETFRCHWVSPSILHYFSF